MSVRRVVIRLLLLAALVVAGCGGTAPGERTGSTVQATGAVVHPQVGFRSVERLEEHWAKHGDEFPGLDRAGYLHRAQALRDAPVGADVLEARRSDGVITRFDRASGAFVAFGPDLVIRTFFVPNDGMDYFERQARR